MATRPECNLCGSRKGESRIGFPLFDKGKIVVCSECLLARRSALKAVIEEAQKWRTENDK